MAEALQNRATIWVLKGARAGDTAQAMTLALQLGGRVESKQLVFNAAAAIPNWIMAGRVSHLTAESRNLLRPPWPDMVIAAGRRTAAASLWIKAQSGGRTKIVQIGRPRLPLAGFDRVLTTPQYGLPSAPNVLTLPFPIVAEKSVPEAELHHFAGVWSGLPRPWILAVVGGAKFPVRLGAGELSNFGKALNSRAQSLGGSVILLDSPRSPTAALQVIAESVNAPHWVFQRGGGPNPYAAGLKLCDELVVTSDSVSMVADMLATQKHVFVFRLPIINIVPRWQAQAGLGRWLAAKGILAPPRNVDGYIGQLLAKGVIGDLQNGTAPVSLADEPHALSLAIADIKNLLKS